MNIEPRRKREPIIKYVRRMLNGPYAGMHSTLAKELDMVQSTISRIASGETDPIVSNVQKLLDKFERDQELASRISVRAEGRQEEKAGS